MAKHFPRILNSSLHTFLVFLEYAERTEDNKKKFLMVHSGFSLNISMEK